MIVKEKVFPLLTERYLKGEEEYWNIKLPKDYRSFILKYNGGEPIKNCFLFKGHEYLIERYLSILEDYNSNSLG